MVVVVAAAAAESISQKIMVGNCKCIQYTCWSLLSLICVLVAIIVQLSMVPKGIEIDLDEIDNHNSNDAVVVFTPKELTTNEVWNYKRDGYIFVEKLLSQDEASLLRNESEIFI